jgi:hypothetical protein
MHVSVPYTMRPFITVIGVQKKKQYDFTGNGCDDICLWCPVFFVCDKFMAIFFLRMEVYGLLIMARIYIYKHK